LCLACPLVISAMHLSAYSGRSSAWHLHTGGKKTALATFAVGDALSSQLGGGRSHFRDHLCVFAVAYLPSMELYS
jgi:hypothetical protein